jgi:poly-gamma-glutamate capsule biosynthesis protein CapA/YwtB (metallophosphatase superfamily)
VDGTVVSLDGEPIEGATVEVIAGGGDVVTEASTEGDGTFGVETDSGPVWLKVEASGFLTRTVAVAPGSSLRVRLTPQQGTVSLSFGGDVMFGRRFYDDSESSGYPWYRILESEREQNHREILSHVQPLLSAADITSVNLETTLTTTGWRHTTKRFVYSSHPTAAAALREAGVDYVALGNNHTFDALKPGLDDSMDALGSADISYSGAGESSETAWEPAYFEEQGITVGLISCTTQSFAGENFDIDWSADKGESKTYTFTQEIDGERESLSFSGDVGVASATEERLTERVEETNETADVTVVQIHGGEEYQRTPTDEIERLTEAASQAGADLVVNHHPHVTGGLEFRGGTLVAWTLGNLVFDQGLWETFPSYLLTVHATEDGVRRAYVDPLLLDGYVPKGVVGETSKSQLRRTAGLSSEEFSLRDGTVEYVDDEVSSETKETLSFSGEGEVFVRESGRIKEVLEGDESVEPGTDLFPTGSFEDTVVDEDGHEGTLWRFDRERAETGPGVGASGAGVSISRHQSNSSRIILSQCARNEFAGPLTLAGLYTYNAQQGLELLVKWHESAGDTDPIEETRYDIEGTGGEWSRLRKDMRPPDGATHVDIYFRVYPPSPRFPLDLKTERVAAFDELRLIEWGDTVDTGGGYDHIRVDGSATVEFAVDGEEDINWKPLWGT